MKVETGIALGTCAVVIGGIIYFAVARETPMGVFDRVVRGAATRVAEPEPEAVPVGEEAKKPKSRPARAVGREADAGVAVAAVPTPEAAPEAVAAEPVAVRRRGPQPKASEIPVGIGRGDLLQRFPDPSLQTSTIKDGDLIELVVYQAEGAGTATFAQLLNGHVTRVYAGVAPAGLRR